MSQPLPASLMEQFGSRCLTTDDRRAPYEIPERGEPGACPAVLLAEHADEVQQVLEAANAGGFGVVLSAGRTGLVEAQRPQGEVVLSLERLNRVIALELADGRRCEPGALRSPDDVGSMLFHWWSEQGRPSLQGSRVEVQAGLAVDALNAVLAPLGRMFPMEMGSSASASVGACVANASAGANAVCYGTAAHMARAAHGFWGNADAAGPCAAPPWQLPSPGVLAIDSTALPEDWGLAGSQGAFGVITSLSLDTWVLPATREAVLLPAQTMAQAMDWLARARARFGDTIEEYEFMGQAAIDLVLRHRGDLRLPFEQRPAEPWLLLLQVKAEQEDAELATHLYEFCAGELGLADEQIGYAPLPALKKLRHSITECSNLEMRARGGGRLSFDTATPVARFGDYLDDLARQLAEARPDALLLAFGHAGVGGAHLHIIGGSGQPLAADAAALTDRVFDVTQASGGTFSAEHGVGPKWARQFLRRVDPRRLQALAARKRRFDAGNVLSPRSFGLDLLLREPAA